ncbi:MAG TPA: tannase/feruloyl esterase family alpha/beta hydrolase [Terriglobia bacterium]|nr:tannase/feruloyl esterase family alpha/beta hydrolase [Terriglobia bacterium]
MCDSVRRKARLSHLLAQVLLVQVLLSSSLVFAASCSNLSALKLKGTTITRAQPITTGTFAPHAGRPLVNLPAFCRVEGIAKPSPDSDIQFEVWMPVSGWNGKFRGAGNGGFAGSISYGDMARALRAGYATASTDTGHRAKDTDAHWALGHPQKVIDFGYRAIHLTALNAKAILKAFYGQPARYSYFESCSDGGREALMEAQRYPGDYNGILAGAPANYWTLLLSAAFFNTQAPGLVNRASYIPASKLPAISAAVLAACDAEDGVKDGILNDPAECHFNPSTLLCKGAESAACLTAPQVAELRKIYAGLRKPDGERLFPGYMPGGELGGGGWKLWITGDAPAASLQYAFGINYFRDMVFDNPAWNYSAANVNTAIRLATRETVRALNATDANLTAFERRGGRLILYHGWSDAAIPPLNTVNYYNSVVARLGRAETKSFVRLYMVPGMQHCGGGPGPSFFGQLGVVRASDPAHNVSAALEQWVEKGIPPESIIAAKYANPFHPLQGVEMTRPLCPYPQIAKYKGFGNPNDAANFVCALP